MITLMILMIKWKDLWAKSIIWTKLSFFNFTRFLLLSESRHKLNGCTKNLNKICVPSMPGGGRPLPHVGGVGLWVVVGGQRPGVTRASSRRRRAGGEEKEEQAAVGRTGRAHLPSQAAGKFCQSLQDWMHKPGRVLLTLFWFGLVAIPLHWIRMRHKPCSKHIFTIRHLQPKLTPTDFVVFFSYVWAIFTFLSGCMAK